MPVTKKVKQVTVHWVPTTVYRSKYKCPSCMTVIYPDFYREIIRFRCLRCGQLLDAKHVDKGGE